MKLKDHITLSQKHQKAFQVFPSFFTSALNEFYFLKDEFGFRKPELDTWKNEANLIFRSKIFQVTIEYECPNWVEVSFRKENVPGKIYLDQLLAKLGIPFEIDFLRIKENNDMVEIDRQMVLRLQKAGTIIKANWGSIFDHICNAESLSRR